MFRLLPIKRLNLIKLMNFSPGYNEALNTKTSVVNSIYNALQFSKFISIAYTGRTNSVTYANCKNVHKLSNNRERDEWEIIFFSGKRPSSAAVEYI